MKSRLRPYLAICLAALLALTGQGIAVARGTPPPVGQMVICTGQSPVMVPVDAEGQPTGPAYICPDAALTFFNAVAADAVLPERVAGRPRICGLAAAPLVRAQARTAPRARGPPVPV